ncbi:MAG TPA: M91 family zinc metallopeptidase [Ktedonobacteraceae bacterium]|nr:M91 family zinc metallopeptidase [Ktedonobacteraceae bacterium]
MQSKTSTIAYASLEGLPNEMLYIVLNFLRPEDILALYHTSKTMQGRIRSYIQWLIESAYLKNVSGGALDAEHSEEILHGWAGGQYKEEVALFSSPELLERFEYICMTSSPEMRKAFLTACVIGAEQNKNVELSQQFYQYIKTLLGANRLINTQTGKALDPNMPVKAIILGLYNGNVLWQVPPLFEAVLNWQAPPCLFPPEIVSGLHEASKQPTTRISASFCETLIPLILDFNACTQTRELAAVKQMFACLDKIEQVAYQWMCDHNPSADEMGREAMRALLSALEQDQCILIHECCRSSETLFLWISPAIDQETAKVIKHLWLSIIAGTGNIKIVSTDPSFICPIWANMAKMLQTQHGRYMLSTLNVPQSDPARAIQIASDWKAAFAAYGIEKWQPGSWALPYAASYKEGDKSHYNGIGTGSYVQIPRKEMIWQCGEQNEPLYQPGFITLGHELGHALHNLQGKSRGHDPVQKGQEGVGESDAELDKWKSFWGNDWEEYQNITNNENALREQSHLPRRRYHAGYCNYQINAFLYPRWKHIHFTACQILSGLPKGCPFPELHQLLDLLEVDWGNISSKAMNLETLKYATALINKAEVLLRDVEAKKADVLATYRQAQSQQKKNNDDNKCVTM